MIVGKSLTGKHIILGASRKTEEMSTLIEKQGGTVSVCPLQGTVFKADEEINPELLRFVDKGSDWIIITTGIGFQTLVESAEKLGLKEAFIKQIKQSSVAVRGYKSIAALKKYDISSEAADDDGTTKGLIRQLESFDFLGKRVLIQLHGEKAPSLISFLESKGAVTTQILPYQHIPPEEIVVSEVCKNIIEGTADAICFTTAIQVHSLFHYACEYGLLEEIKQGLMSQTLAVAVGKVTAEALRDEGIQRVIVPNHERMGAMIMELAKYYESKQ